MLNYNFKARKRVADIAIRFASFFIVVASTYLIVSMTYMLGISVPPDDSDQLLTNIIRLPRPARGTIMIGIQLTDYMGSTEFTASTIKNFHDVDDGDIFVFTRHAFEYNDNWLTRWYGRNIKVIKLSKAESSMKKMLQLFVYSNYKALFLIDSNIVFLPSWRDFITKHILMGNQSFLSLYHSARMHNYTRDCQNYVGDLCVGAVSAKFGVVLSKKLAKLILLKHLELVDIFDWNGILEKEQLSPLYPRKSLVINIEQTARDQYSCGENDVPYEFQLCQLPRWIRDGIEFYFDRCTNPQELFYHETSLKHADIYGRLWTKPVVAYSLYGDKTRYTDGAIANAKRLFSSYPGWKIWIYIDNTVPKYIVDQLCSKNVRFINTTGTDISNQMSWRFLVASEPVKMFTVLDIDYRMIARGKEAVDDWVKSGRKFHVMRDHPNHSKC